MSRPAQARLVDAAIDAYVDWREECVTLRDAYERWARAPRADSRLAFAGYWAAVDREERAARAYGDLIVRLADAAVTASPASPASPRAAASARISAK